MGLWPTRGNENHRCRPRESGDPLPVQWIPAFAGMTRPGVIFRRAAGDEESRSALKMLRARFLASLGTTVRRRFPRGLLGGEGGLGRRYRQPSQAG